MDLQTLLSLRFLYGCLTTALLLLAGHWFPWPEWLGDKLPRLACYVYGVLSIWIGYAIWVDDATQAGGLFIICAVGGAAVMIAYGLDRLALDRAQARRTRKAADHARQ